MPVAETLEIRVIADEHAACDDGPHVEDILHHAVDQLVEVKRAGRRREALDVRVVDVVDAGVREPQLYSEHLSRQGNQPRRPLGERSGGRRGRKEGVSTWKSGWRT